MNLNFFQQPKLSEAGSPAPKSAAMTDELNQAGRARSDQERIDDRRSLEAAVSEGWPVLPPHLRATPPKPHQPYRTGSQTWLRRRAVKEQAS